MKQRIFFTADTHFGHARIIDMCGRPYADVHQMNSAMIDAWNAVVRPDDEVWHLGDFAHRAKSSPASFFERLHGRKHLVVGNHDDGETTALAWASMQQMAHVVVDHQRLHLCHYPMLEWPGSFRGAIHLFGHCHGRRLGMPGSLDVGVDVSGFRPLTLDDVRRRLAAVERTREIVAATRGEPAPGEDRTP